MADNPFGLPCCQTIVKAFERSAAYSVTEEATFALMTAPLNNIRTSTAAFIQHENSTEAASNPLSTEQKSSGINLGASQAMNLKGLDKSDDKDESFFQNIRGNFIDGQAEGTGEIVDANLFGNIFNNECIPCGARLNTLGEMNKDIVVDYGKQWLALWKASFTEMMNQIRDLLNIFNNLDKFVDLCALLRFLKDFVCLPDLQRILSVLMALMMKVSFELGGVFDLILGLIGPILTPFLSGLVDILMKYILLVVAPIECIIDALQNIIRKLDYNVLFDNISKLEKPIKPKSRGADPRGPIKIPFTDGVIKRRDIVSGEGALDKISNAGNTGFNNAVDASGGSAIKARKIKEQAAVDRAAQEIAALNAAASNVDMADANATERHKTKKKAATQKYKDAVQERDTKNIAEDLFNAKSAVDSADRTVQSIKGMLFNLMAQLREAMESIEAFVAELVDELQKLLGEYVGGQSGMIAQITKKFAIVQMLGLISSIISAFSKGCDDDDDEGLRIEAIVASQQGLQIWTDDNGDVHIEQDSKEIDRAIQVAVKSIGAQANSQANSSTPTDKGENPLTPGQKLKKLIEFTGDPILDAEIARTTEALVTPVKVTFKCPLQTGVAEADQVNQWIESLNT